MHKICSKCKEHKLFSDFSRDIGRKDGYQPSCKTCHKNYLVENKNRISIQRSEHYSKNKERLLDCGKFYRTENKDKISNKQKEYYQENKEIILVKAKEYRESNSDKISEYQKEYASSNRHKLKKYLSTYIKKHRETNRDLYAAKDAKRRAAKLHALPKWLTAEQLEQIKELYTIAQMFKLYTGQEYHVDHIVPLQGENVCGLHVPWNLQVIPASENLSKSNKLQEELL